MGMSIYILEKLGDDENEVASFGKIHGLNTWMSRALQLKEVEDNVEYPITREILEQLLKVIREARNVYRKKGFCAADDVFNIGGAYLYDVYVETVTDIINQVNKVLKSWDNSKTYVYWVLY